MLDFIVDDWLRRGEVLRHRSARGPSIHALCLPGRQGVPKIRAFIEFIAEVLGDRAVGAAPAER